MVTKVAHLDRAVDLLCELNEPSLLLRHQLGRRAVAALRWVVQHELCLIASAGTLSLIYS